MTWHETRARWRILREIAEASTHDASGTLPWTEEYAEVFGDRDALVAALRYRLTNTQRAQTDMFLTEPVLEERLDDMAARHAGVVRILERHEAEKAREALPNAS
jgi:hypothetical protein